MRVVIRLVALDIDLTLTGPDGVIMPVGIDAVRRARNVGVAVALLSTRPPAGVDEIARLIDGPVYRVCYGGAVIRDERREVRRFVLDEDTARAVARLADEQTRRAATFVAPEPYGDGVRWALERLLPH